MARFVVLGSGGIGRATARHLVDQGGEVVVASRSGVPEPPAGARGAQVDATDPDALATLLTGADAVVNALNPARYWTWEIDWPPMAGAILAAAERSGAGLVTISNLYGYGPTEPADRPFDESTPLAATGRKGRVRAAMWRDALAAQEAGRVRATELRASDYVGPGARGGVAYLNTFVLDRARRGRTVVLPRGVPDAPHTWTYLDDIGRLAAVLATDPRGWGRAWHVPSAPARSVLEVVDDVARLTGARPVRVTRMPAAAMWAARVHPLIRELDETRYQFERPFVMDSSAATTTFGLAATPWDDTLTTTLRALAAADS